MCDYEPLDVWLKFDDPDDLEDAWASHEANTYETSWGYEIRWYHNDVGLVTRVPFATLEEAHKWYADNGFHDFTS